MIIFNIILMFVVALLGVLQVRNSTKQEPGKIAMQSVRMNFAILCCVLGGLILLLPYQVLLKHLNSIEFDFETSVQEQIIYLVRLIGAAIFIAGAAITGYKMKDDLYYTSEDGYIGADDPHLPKIFGEKILKGIFPIFRFFIGSGFKFPWEDPRKYLINPGIETKEKEITPFNLELYHDNKSEGVLVTKVTYSYQINGNLQDLLEQETNLEKRIAESEGLIVPRIIMIIHEVIKEYSKSKALVSQEEISKKLLERIQTNDLHILKERLYVVNSMTVSFDRTDESLVRSEFLSDAMMLAGNLGITEKEAYILLQVGGDRSIRELRLTGDSKDLGSAMAQSLIDNDTKGGK